VRDNVGDAEKMQDVKMQDWKIRHKAAEGGKCRNGKSGKRKV